MDKVLRAKILCVILLMIGVYGFHLIPHDKINVTEKRFVPYGSYGLVFTKMLPKKKKRVIILGNSVEAETEVVKEVIDLKNASEYDFEIGNFSMTGASIADYLITYNYIRRFEPDLLVVRMAPTTFGDYWPLYRNESNKFILHPMMKTLHNKFILNTFTREDLVKSFLYSYFPIFHKLFIYSYQIKKRLNRYAQSIFHKPLMDFFPYSLNQPEEWKRVNAQSASRDFRQYPEAEDLLKFFIGQLKQDDLKTVFNLQENDFDPLPLTEHMAQFLTDHPQIAYYDSRGYYKKSEFKDAVHPKEGESSQRIARRLFDIIVKNLH